MRVMVVNQNNEVASQKIKQWAETRCTGPADSLWLHCNWLLQRSYHVIHCLYSRFKSKYNMSEGWSPSGIFPLLLPTVHIWLCSFVLMTGLWVRSNNLAFKHKSPKCFVLFHNLKELVCSNLDKDFPKHGAVISILSYSLQESHISLFWNLELAYVQKM